MKTILLGVCGSVASYKAAALVRLLTTQGVNVQVMLTEAAAKFVGAATFRALSGRPVAGDEWNAPLAADGMDHIHLIRAADALLVAPASADFLAKAAAGIADNTLLSAFLAADCPRFVAPAMNQQMWHAAATQRNISQLAADGVLFIGPTKGAQACGENGDGRMAEPADIAEELQRLTAKPLSGRRVVISTGATVEHIDEMRIISNISSGKMGFCLATAAAAAGAEVRIVAAQTTAPPPSLPLRRALSSQEMLAALTDECRHADILIATAAVADFAPRRPKRGKIPRQNSLTIELFPTIDILATITRRYPNLFAVGFAAQSGGQKTRTAAARKKMRHKNLALIVSNAVSDASLDDCQLSLHTPQKNFSLPRQPKEQAASMLIAQLAEFFAEKNPSMAVQ